MKETIKITAVGDILLACGIESLVKRKGHEYLLKSVEPHLNISDIVIGNLECPISNTGVSNVNQESVIARPNTLDVLTDAGFNAVSLANNHMMDFGISGLQDTIIELENRSINYAGAGIDKKTKKQPGKISGYDNVTFLSYYGRSKKNQGGTNGAEKNRVLADIQKAKDENKIIIVNIHWGRYNRKLPQKHQVEFAHQMIDFGANLIIGSGPHVLQPVELYHGGVIAYSLGNFLFDHTINDPPNPDTQLTMMLNITFVKNAVKNVTIQPIYINNEFRPEPIEPDKEPQLFKKVTSLLVEELNTYESDSQTALILLTRKKHFRPIKTLKKIFIPSERAYPLSFYFRSFIKLINERLSAK